MKKLLILLLVFLSCLPVFADTVYEIETSHGIQQVVIPDGYTAVDVLLKISQAYYELNWDYEELSEKAAQLSEDIKSYIEENNQLQADYKALTADYELLVAELKRLSKLTPVSGIIGLGFGYYEAKVYPSLSLGVELYERFSLITSIHLINLKPAIGIGVNYHF